MRALISPAPGGPETLVIGKLPEPVAGPGHLLVDVRAAGVNFPDTLVIEDKYQIRPPRPFAPGGELAGVVSGIGAGVEGWSIGDRVAAVSLSGAMAERIALPADMAFRLPDERSFEEGAALLFTYGTVIYGLLHRGGLKPGETLLVLGAAGGIGMAAVELGKALGARVVAAVSSEEKAAAAREAGADETVVYPRGSLDKAASKALADAFKAACGDGGADIVLDPVGGDYAEPALRSIAWEGRFLVVGFPAGIPVIPLNLPLLKSCDIRGVAWGAAAMRDPALNRAYVDQLFDLWRQGKIAPRISATYPLERGGDAIALLGQRAAIGKIVVTL